MEHDTEGVSEPQVPPFNEDVDMNNTASPADTSGATVPLPSTDAPAPATAQAVETATASTGQSPGINTPQGSRTWGQGLMGNSTQHVPDDSDTTAKAMAAVMEALPDRIAEKVDESVLDENAEFIISRLNHH